MRLWLTLTMLLLSGCTQPSTVAESDPDVVTGDCILAYPDGAPAPCTQEWTEMDGTERPSPLDGWRCVRQRDDPVGRTEVYMTPAGRVGVYWEFEPWKSDGLAFQRIAAYVGRGDGVAIHVPYAPQGFAALPGTFSAIGTGQIDALFVLMRAFEDRDGWGPAENVTFHHSLFGADPWWGITVDHPGGPYHLSPMREQRNPEITWEWAPAFWEGEIDGTPFIFEPDLKGVRYTSVTFDTMRLSLDCTSPFL